MLRFSRCVELEHCETTCSSADFRSATHTYSSSVYAFHYLRGRHYYIAFLIQRERLARSLQHIHLLAVHHMSGRKVGVCMYRSLPRGLSDTAFYMKKFRFLADGSTWMDGWVFLCHPPRRPLPFSPLREGAGYHAMTDTCASLVSTVRALPVERFIFSMHACGSVFDS